jgi:hypothetical protein
MFQISNKLNTVTLDPQNPANIIKTGPANSIASEAQALQHLQPTGLVPRVYEFTEGKIIMEQLPGLTVSELYSKHLLTPQILESILTKIERIHALPVDPHPQITTSTVKAWLEHKFRSRMNLCIRPECNYKKHIDLKNNGGAHCCNACKLGNGHGPFCGRWTLNIPHTLLTWLKSYSVSEIKPTHGDPWLANIIYNTNNTIKFIDPRGSCCNINTLLNDKNYDYAKILQSLLGYDHALFNYPHINAAQQAGLLSTYTAHITKLGLNYTTLKYYAQMLMHSSQFFVPDNEAKIRIEKILLIPQIETILVISINVHELTQYVLKQIENIKTYVECDHVIIFNCNEHMYRKLKQMSLPQNIILNPDVINKAWQHGSLFQGIISNMKYALTTIKYSYFMTLSSRNMFYAPMDINHLAAAKFLCANIADFIKNQKARPLKRAPYPSYHEHLQNTLFTKYYINQNLNIKFQLHEGTVYTYNVTANIINFLSDKPKMFTQLINTFSAVEEYATPTIAFYTINPNNMEYNSVRYGRYALRGHGEIPNKANPNNFVNTDKKNFLYKAFRK